ncbi:MAG: hypothetical protein AAF696_29930, partial [Bacteroidota bacterium]
MITVPATLQTSFFQIFYKQTVLLFCFSLLAFGLIAQEEAAIVEGKAAYELTKDNHSLSLPKVLQKGKEAVIGIQLKDAPADLESLELMIGSERKQVEINNGRGSFSLNLEEGEKAFSLSSGAYETLVELPIVSFPPWMSILPPLIAIVLALIFREVVVSLFLGIFSGAAVLAVYSGAGIKGVFTGFLTVIDTYVINALTDSGHLSIVVFSLLIGGMVGVISKNGGMQGIVNRISKIATTAKMG